VTKHDDGSRPGMYDWKVCYRDGRHAAADVVSTHNRAAMKLEDAVGSTDMCRALS
jgi:hypothetical protein